MYQRCISKDVAASCQNFETLLVRWIPPQSGWVALNTDGAARRDTVVAGCGGALRDQAGRWICGFVKHLGDANVYVAELWGVLEGLKIAKAQGFGRVEVNVDSQVVVNTLKGKSVGSVGGWPLVQRIRLLLDMNWQVRIRHVYREANKVADELANMGCELGAGVMFYETPPYRVNPLILADAMGVSTPRVISV